MNRDLVVLPEVRPGSLDARLVTLINDPREAGVRNFGRVTAVSQYAATLDAPVTMASGQSYWLRLELPDGTISDQIPVSNSPGTTSSITLAAPGFPTGTYNTPVPGATWILVGTDIAPTQWRVLSVSEENDGTFAYTCLNYYPGKFSYVENGMALADTPYTVWRDDTRPLPAPTGLTVTESVGGIGATSNLQVTLGWVAPADPRIEGFQVQALIAGAIVVNQTVSGVSLDMNFLSPATMQFQVRSVGPNGQTSPWTNTGNVTVDGVTPAPNTPSSLAATGQIRQNTVTWVNPTNSRFFRTVEVWASSTSSFGSGSKVGESAGGQFIHSNLATNQSWWYWVRAADTLGGFSAYVGPVSATTSYLLASDIQSGIINTAAFAAGIEPITIVSGLPTSRQTSLVYLTTDGKIYRWDTSSSSYIASVSSVSLTGTLTAGNFPAGLQPIQIVSSLPTGLGSTDQGKAYLLTTTNTINIWTGSAWTSAVDASTITGTLTQARFPSNLQPVQVVSSLPTGLTSANAGQTAFLTTDNKLYRFNGTSWISTVSASDLSGALSLSQFPTGLQPVQVVSSLPVGLGSGNAGQTAFLTGDGKLYRWTGSAWTAAVSTSDITGTLSQAQFPTNLQPVQVVGSLPTGLGAGNVGQTALLTSDSKIYRWNGAA
jgi:hypothetical protein